jgi:hypothetical protein
MSAGDALASTTQTTGELQIGSKMKPNIVLVGGVAAIESQVGDALNRGA